MRFVAFGELMLDLEITTGAGAHSAAIHARPGGTAANAAVWAAAAGARAACIGRVGADAAGSALEAALTRAGVTPLLEVDPELGTGAFALLDGAVAVDRGANRALTAPSAAALAGDALLVSGYALLPETAGAALAALAASPAHVRVVTGGSAAVVARHRDAFAEAAAAATLLVLDEAEADALGAVDTALCVSRGPAGATLRLDGREVSAAGSGIPGDARGAGDALAATLAVELARGTEPADAVARACAVGARAAASPTGWP